MNAFDRVGQLLQKLNQTPALFCLYYRQCRLNWRYLQAALKHILPAAHTKCTEFSLMTQRSSLGVNRTINQGFTVYNPNWTAAKHSYRVITINYSNLR